MEPILTFFCMSCAVSTVTVPSSALVEVKKRCQSPVQDRVVFVEGTNGWLLTYYRGEIEAVCPKCKGLMGPIQEVLFPGGDA